MNSNRNMIGIALIALTATMVYLLTTSVGAEATWLFGKAVWYLPYASFIGAVRFFRAA